MDIYVVYNIYLLKAVVNAFLFYLTYLNIS